MPLFTLFDALMSTYYHYLYSVLPVPPDLGTLLSFFVSDQAPSVRLQARFCCLKPKYAQIPPREK